MNDFPRFWFDANLFTGMIKNEADLKKLFKIYEGQLSSHELLTKSYMYMGVNVDNEVLRFSLRYKADSDLTLGQHLRNYSISKLLEN